MDSYDFLVTEEEEGIRLDRLLAELCPDQSRSYLQKLLKEGAVTVNQEPSPPKPSYRVHENDHIHLTVPDQVLPIAVPQNIPLEFSVPVSYTESIRIQPAPSSYAKMMLHTVLFPNSFVNILSYADIRLFVTVLFQRIL